MRASRGLESERRGTPPGWPCAEAQPPELGPGTVVGSGRFEVRALLGRGGMATVYRGHDRQRGRDVALKVMLAAWVEHAVRVRRFEREAELAARLPVHPGLLRLLHAGRLPELDGRPFLVTEPVQGPTLAFRLAGALRMPPRRAAGLALGLAEGLAAAHGVGVVHRDVTARNVVLRAVGGAGEGEEQPVLVDFGLAAAIEPNGARLTRPHQRPGTVTAMAPEQFRGAPARPAMDVYALGRLLHQMLTGEDPHATVSRERLLACHREGVRVVPRLVDRDGVAPPGLASVADACTEPDPTRRPSAEELCAELRVIERALRDEDVGTSGAREELVTGASAAISSEIVVITPPRGPWSRRRRTPRRRRAARWSGIAVGIMSMAVLGVARWSGGRDPVEAAATARWAEPVAVAWPSTVVPLVEPPARPIPRPGRDRVDGATAGSWALGRTIASAKAASVSACEVQRERARAAARRWAWAEVLEATVDATCWPDPEARTRLRLTAWIEEQRFDACVEEGVHAVDPVLVRLAERCRRRQARTGAGGLP